MLVTIGMPRATGTIVLSRDCKIGVLIEAPHENKK